MATDIEIKSIELSPEQLEAIEKMQEAERQISKFVLEVFEVIKDACQEALKVIRAFWVRMGRALFLVRLLKMKIPYWLSNYIAENIYWVWACKWGFGLLKSN